MKADVTTTELNRAIARKLVKQYNDALARRGEAALQVEYDALAPDVKLLVTYALCEGYRWYMANGRNRN